MNKKNILIIISIALVVLLAFSAFLILKERRINFAREVEQRKEQYIVIDKLPETNNIKKTGEAMDDSLAIMRKKAMSDSIFYRDIIQDPLKALRDDYFPTNNIHVSTRKYWEKHIYMGEFRRNTNCAPAYYVNFNIHNTSEYDIYGVEPPFGLNEHTTYFKIPAHSVCSYCWWARGEILFFIGKLDGQDMPLEVKETFSIRYKVSLDTVRKWVLQIIKEEKINNTDDIETIKGGELMYFPFWGVDQDINSWQDIQNFIHPPHKKQ